MIEIKNRYTGAVIHTVDADTLSGADLSWANLGGGALAGADLAGADLSGANLSGANLSGAILDFSCWPLWCGTQHVIVDDQIRDQLALHLYWILEDDDPLRPLLHKRAKRAADKRSVGL